MRFSILATLLLFVMAGRLTAQEITGQFENSTSNSIKAVYTDPTSLEVIVDSITVDSYGNFQYRMQVEEPVFVRISGDKFNFRFFIYPKDRLHVKADCSNHSNMESSIQFSRSAALYNAFIPYKLISTRVEAFDYSIPVDSFVSRQAVFLHLRNHLRDSILRSQHKGVFTDRQNKYKTLDSLNDVYLSLTALYDYSRVHDEWDSTTTEKFRLKHVFDKMPKKLDRYFTITDYFVVLYDKIIVGEYRKAQEKDSTITQVQSINGFRFNNAGRFLNGHFLKAYYAYIYQGQLPHTYTKASSLQSLYRLDSLSSRYERFIDNKTITANTRKKIDSYKIARAGIFQKEFAPDFEMQSSDETNFQLSKIKNKVTYIDVWASWCGPCIGEMPDHAKVVEFFKHDSAVVFLSINMDTSKTVWQKAMSLYKPAGLQLWNGSQDFESQFAKNYAVVGLPKYILISKEGKLITDVAPRPSDFTAIVNEIEKLLKN